MFNRLRASMAGEPSSPEKSPHPPNTNNQQPQAPPQRPGFLPPFFSNPPSNNNNGTSENSSRAAAAPSPTPERSFLSNFLPQAQQSPKPSPPGEASPRTIRASASALLKLATPPPLGNDSNSNLHREMDPNALNDGIDTTDLAQRDTLEHQMNRRDSYISKLQSDLHKMQSNLSQYTKDTNTLRRQQLESTHRHGIAVKLWRRTNDGLQARVECFENETTPAAAREIANLIRDAAPPNKDSAYLMMLQDQLTKATVKLDHLGSQTEIVLHKGEEVVESLREEMNEVIRERCRMELELLDQERMLEDDMRRMVVRTERRLRRVQGEIDFLEKNAVECLKNQESEDGEEMSDEDDEGASGESKEDDTADNEGKGDGYNVDANGKKDGEDADEEGDNQSCGSESSGDGTNSNGEQDKPTTESDAGGPSPTASNATKKDEETPEILRKELRQLAMERDRTLSVLQKKLREKNDEFHSLMRLKDTRAKCIHKMEAEKKDREEWERCRQDLI